MQRKLYDCALENKQLSAGVAAGREISVLTGHRIERAEIGGPGEFDHLTDDELERAIIEQFVGHSLRRQNSDNASGEA